MDKLKLIEGGLLFSYGTIVIGTYLTVDDYFTKGLMFGHGVGTAISYCGLKMYYRSKDKSQAFLSSDESFD